MLGQVYSRLNLGKEYQHAGQLDRARDSYTRATEIARVNHRTDLQHAAQLSLARLLMATDSQLGEAWRIITAVNDQVFPDGEYQTQVLTLHLLARIANTTNRRSEHQAVLFRLLKLSKDAGDRYVEMSTRASLASLILSQADAGVFPRGGLIPSIEDLLSPVSATANPYIAAESHCILAMAHRRVAELDSARQESRLCLAATADLGDLTDLSRALSVDAFVQAATDRPAAEKSWGRAVSLVDSPVVRASMTIERLELLGAMGAYDELPAQVPKARAALKTIREAQQDAASRSGLSHTRGQYIALASTWISGIGVPPQAPTDLRLALELSEIARGAPADLHLDLSAIQSTLQPGSALVAYLLPVTQIRGWAAVITRTTVRAVRIPGEEPIGPLVDTLVGLVASHDPNTSVTARALYDRLIAPLELPPDTHEIIFVPNGALHHLPFGLLEGEHGPLGLSHSTHLIPSLSAWIERDTPSKEPISTALIVADPSNDKLPPLPHSREEAAWVRRSLGVSAAPLVGQQATLEALLDPKSPEWVHIAAHLLNDSRFPADSSIPLAGASRLSTHDVRERGWEGAVVVLSACDSASGRVLGGEEAQGMTRAFLESDASVVIGSLWPLRDDDAARFFDLFYGFIADGEDLQHALDHTRQALFDESAPPEAWAGVVLVGDGRRSIPPTRSAYGIRRVALLAGLILGLLLVAGLAYSRRSRMNRSS